MYLNLCKCQALIIKYLLVVLTPFAMLSSVPYSAFAGGKHSSPASAKAEVSTSDVLYHEPFGKYFGMCLGYSISPILYDTDFIFRSNALQTVSETIPAAYIFREDPDLNGSVISLTFGINGSNGLGIEGELSYNYYNFGDAPHGTLSLVVGMLSIFTNIYYSYLPLLSYVDERSRYAPFGFYFGLGMGAMAAFDAEAHRLVVSEVPASSKVVRYLDGSVSALAVKVRSGILINVLDSAQINVGVEHINVNNKLIYFNEPVEADFALKLSVFVLEIGARVFLG